MYWYWLDTLSFPIGVNERPVDNNGVSELCKLSITDYNNGPLLGVSYPKMGRKINRKKWCLKALIYTSSTIYVEQAPQCFLLVFCALSSEGKLCINFLKHAVDMFNELLYSLGDFGKICLPHPYTTVSLIFLVHWQIFPNFACGGCMRKSTNFDHIFGKTNRIRSSATTTPPLLYIVCITTTILGISQLHTLWQIFAHLCPQLNCFPQAFPHDTSVTWHGMLLRSWKIWNWKWELNLFEATMLQVFHCYKMFRRALYSELRIASHSSNKIHSRFCFDAV